MRRVYNVGELRKAVSKINESASEFKAVYGNSVQDDNKKINRQAYNDIKKETSEYDGGLSNKRKPKPATLTPTENRGMSDINYDGISKPFKDKVKSQIKGYVSADAEKLHKNDDFGNADFDSNNLSDSIEKHAKEAKKEKDKLMKTGLTGSTQNKDDVEKRSDTMFESKMKNIKFRRTKFLSEDHMLSKIPDDFKIEGKKFMMSDCDGNSYIVEWHQNSEPDVEKRLNKKSVNEELDRIKGLFDYKSKDYFNTTTAKSRVEENREFSDMIDKARKLMR